MNREEACVRYQIPLDVMQTYEQWRMQDMAEAATMEYTTQDIECLSMMVTLYHIGFTTEEVKLYMKLLHSSQDTRKERLVMLEKMREQVMHDIHAKQERVDQLDYLRYQIRLQP